jgi:hypothetical protein
LERSVWLPNVRIENDHAVRQGLACKCDRFDEIRISRHDASNLAAAAQRVVYEVGGEVDIGALLLEVDDANRLRRVVDAPPPHLVALEQTEMTRQVRKRRERSEENLLSQSSIRVIHAAFDARSEVPDEDDVCLGQQEVCQLREVQPAMLGRVEPLAGSSA